MKYEEKIAALEKIIRDYGKMAVAFSGGVDSTFLLLFSHRLLGKDLLAVTACGPHFSPDEIREAKELCASNDISHLVLDLGSEILRPFAHNPEDRCYICKKAIFEQLSAELAARHPGIVLADGTNLDDTKDYRPGQKALQELGISSPLKEAGLTKAEIRRGLKELGGDCWDKPAFACLASRIPYGEEITEEKLTAIYKAERALQDLGFVQVRVRHHGSLARIEVDPAERSKFFDAVMLDRVQALVKEVGFLYVTMDLGGYRMGSLNQELTEAPSAGRIE